MHDFQVETLKCVALRILQHLPYYQRNPDELDMGLNVPGELPAHGFSSPVTLLVFKENKGALQVALELVQECGQHSKAATISIEECDMLEADRGGPGNTKLLLYLNQDTFRDVGGKLAVNTKRALDQNIPFVLVHEQDASKGGCPFGTLMAQTPRDLQLPPYMLFDNLAVPYFPFKLHGKVSRQYVLRNLGAHPLRTSRESSRESATPFRGNAAPAPLPSESENTNSLQESGQVPSGLKQVKGVAAAGNGTGILAPSTSAPPPRALADVSYLQSPQSAMFFQQPMFGPPMYDQALPVGGMPTQPGAAFYPSPSPPESGNFWRFA